MARMLFQYRITPHSTTGVTPAELLFGRRIRSHLGQLIPDLAAKVESKQAAQKRDHDNHSDTRTFQIGDPVFVRNYTKVLLGCLEKLRRYEDHCPTLSFYRMADLLKSM